MLVENFCQAAMPVKFQPTKGQSKRTKISASLSKRIKIVDRLWNAAEWQVCEIEERLQLMDSTNTQFERDARSLGLLAKFLKELVSIEAIINTAKNSVKAEIEDKDAPPRDLEQFRLELEKRLDAMRKGRQPETADGDDGSALAECTAG